MILEVSSYLYDSMIAMSEGLTFVWTGEVTSSWGHSKSGPVLLFLSGSLQGPGAISKTCKKKKKKKTSASSHYLGINISVCIL